MNNVPRETLLRIITKYGSSVFENPKRCEALLRDLCGAYRREINILMGALDERVPLELMNAGKALPREVLLARLAKRLQDQLAYTEDAAHWAVDSWALALGVISSTEAEIRAKAAAQTKEQAGEPRAAPPRNPASHHPTSQNNARRQSAPPATQKPVPPRQPTPSVPNRTTLPLQPPTPPRRMGQSTNSSAHAQNRFVPITSPPATSPLLPNAQPSMSANKIAQQPSPFTVEPPSRRIGKLRGCLLIFLLLSGLIVLAVFVVPAVITLLRQEQLKPSINEPRIPRGN